MISADTAPAHHASPDVTKAPIVFLHIPKTAGQTVHSALSTVVGADRVSPVRVHTQAQGEAPQMPAGYGLYSGHLDWLELETLPEDRFVFTVLRDPYERLASFYFFLLKQAQALTPQELELNQNTGKRILLQSSAEDYFFNGPPPFQQFIRDHYDNFYCSYLATRKMRAQKELRDLDLQGKVQAALKNAPLIDRIYSTRDLGALERDIAERYGAQISVQDTYINKGDDVDGEALRWPRLLTRFESDAAIRRLEAFVEADMELIDTLGITV
jgi:hypothetical protein